MLTTMETIEAEALQLPPSDRARLIERLIASFEIDPDIDDAWAAEVQRRHSEVENAAVSMLPGPETLARLKSEFR